MNDKTASELFWGGYRKFRSEDYAGAIKDYTKCIELDPNDADSFMARADAKSCLEDHKGGIEDLTEYLKIKPKDPKGFAMRADTKAFSKDFDGAILDYEKSKDLGYDKSYIDENIGQIKKIQESYKMQEEIPKRRKDVLSNGKESISKKLEKFKEQKQEQKNENEIEL